MEYRTKWRNSSEGNPSYMGFPTKLGAEQWAFARIADGFEDVWIEDEHGNIVVANEELRRRRTLEGSR